MYNYIIGDRMYITYNNKKIKVNEKKDFWSRFKGIMLQKEKIQEALLFKRCNSIHTFFCKQNIMVIMTDKSNKIIYFNNNVKPNKIIIKPKAYNTYELPPYYFNDLKINTYLKKEDD